MAISDYNTDPDLNTSISGINIAEGCPPSGINNAIRQLMADVKTQVDTDGTTYLPLTGGTMTGTLTFSNGKAIGDYLPLAGGTMTGNIAFPARDSSTSQLQFKNGDGTLNGSVSAFGNELGIGWAYGSGHGAGLALRSKNYPNNGGGWDLIAKANSTEVSLSGRTDGSLKWNGKQVDTIDSSGSGWIRYVNGIQICWGTISFSGQTGTVDKSVTYPKAFNANPAATLGPAWAYGSEKGYFTSYSKTGFTLRGENTNNNSHSYLWIAIGYWK